MFVNLIACLMTVGTLMLATLAPPAAAAPPKTVELPPWTAPAGVETTPFNLGAGDSSYQVFGGGAQVRWFADERLPACFERTLELEKVSEGTTLKWIFTGPRAGLTVMVTGRQVQVQRRFYDSPAFNEGQDKKPRHAEWTSASKAFDFDSVPRAITVRADAVLGVTILVNGKTLTQQSWLQDLVRHQVRLEGKQPSASGRMLQPSARAVTVRVDPARRHQTMLGFGGIATPPAYAELSDAGKQRWWRLIADYNLLIQREYPMGARLNQAMDNWDRLADAAPHYYADNFPNGEVSDFEYIKTLRGLGGQVWFEFWALPPSVTSKKGVDYEKYAAAMVRYCQVSKEKAGAPPEIVGVQNEVGHEPATYHAMALTLRKALDTAGFQAVKIHLPDRPRLGEGIETAKVFKANPEAWKVIDYAASHMYDFQGAFTKPDDYDARLREWKQVTGDKPTLSTELCVNSSDDQADSFRLALQMGQLYHKNLVLADAVAVAYCWLLLNVEQPSYGATRSLFVSSPQTGDLPVASSHQLRVFGAYSRYLRRGMTRAEATSPDQDLLVCAFADEAGHKTLVALNRSLTPLKVAVDWPGADFTRVEAAGPYQPNTALPSGLPVTVAPGSIVTLTTWPATANDQGVK